MTEKTGNFFPPFESVRKKLSFNAAIRTYLKRSVELQDYLKQKPDDWGKFQEEINGLLDAMSVEMARFEKANLKREKKIYKLKRFFVNRLRKYFVYGHFIQWSLKKPYGYAGDFQIIDDIYANRPTSKGFDRLWDNYFLRMGPSIATRNRKEDFKKIIGDFLSTRGKKARVMDLASGPCREIKELFDLHPAWMADTLIDCYDFDDHAIEYAKKILGDRPGVRFFKKNALRMALKKDIKEDIPYEYDLIFSTGLYDYLDERVATRLTANLKRLLKKDGLLCISNYRDKETNPWAHLMEWVAEWSLIYRAEEEFVKIFTDVGFPVRDISLQYEPLKIMQYCLARNS